MKDLSQSWMDRLQLISVIVSLILSTINGPQRHSDADALFISLFQTTFFASTEAGLLSVMTPDTKGDSTRLEQASSAGLMGALLIHVFACMSRPFMVIHSIYNCKNTDYTYILTRSHHLLPGCILPREI